MVAVYKKQSLRFSHQFHLQTVYCAFQDFDYWSIYLEKLRKSLLLSLPSTSLLFSGV